MPPRPSGKLSLPLEGTGSAQWWTRQLDWAADSRKSRMSDMRKSVAAYRDELKADSDSAIRVNIEYEKTEQKRHQLFFRNPALSLSPSPRTLRDQTPDPLTGQPRDARKAVAIFKEYLQKLAGPKKLDTKALLDQLLFDVLCPAGYGVCKIGYERFEQGTIPVQVGTKDVPMPGSVLGLQTMQVPEYGEAPNVVFDRYFVSRISPAKALIPPDFTGKVYHRDADWLGHDFWIDRADAKRRGWAIAAEVTSRASDDDDRLVPLDQQGDRTGQLKCREVFFYASRVDPSVAHPEKIRRLVFVDGSKEPVVYEDSKDQRWDPRGRLTGGLRTLPIHVLTLRYVSDYPFPPSDCRVSRRQSDELSEFRSLMMLQRKKARSLRWINIDEVVDETVKAKLLRGEHYDIIPVSGSGNNLMGIIPDPQQPRDNYTANDYLMSDVDRQWAMGGNAQGVKEKTTRTATEIAALSQATAGRMGAEQGAVVAFWLGLLEDVASLVQLYADTEEYVEVVGPDGARSIEAFTKDTVGGMDFLFDIVPDSAAPPDAAAERDLALNRYNLLANDPFIVREQLVRDTVSDYQGDPDRLVQAPAPPPPEKPKIALSIKGEDLNPEMPQYTNVVTLLDAAGVLNGPMEPPREGANTPDGESTGAAGVVDRERLRMAGADEGHTRGGALVGAGE